jgi:hypothetical protein
MAHLTPIEMFKIRFIGVLYAFAYFSAHRSFLGARLSSWLKFILIVFTITAWFTRQPLWAIVGAAVLIGVYFFYWYVKRQGYIRFIPIQSQAPHSVKELLRDNKKVKARATGTFSVSSHEAYVLQKPAEYWRVPIGDHAIMVEHMPGKFLYQFIQSGALQTVAVGFLIFGRRPQEALAVRFLTTWGPEFGQYTPKQLMAGANHTPAKLERTIYLTFEDARDQYLVRKNLLRDAGKPLHKPMIE